MPILEDVGEIKTSEPIVEKPARKCGSCTLCCRLTAVPELRKKQWAWCHHCSVGVGCSIYGSRPPSCQKFECMWLKDETMPDSLRPDRSKVVMEKLSDRNVVLFLVNPGNGMAWARKKEMDKQMKVLLNRGLSIAVVGDFKAIIPGKGKNAVDVRRDIEQFAADHGVKIPNGSAVIHDRPHDSDPS